MAALYFVIPAQAGTQAVPRQSEARVQRTEIEASSPLPNQLKAGLGAAWIPAFAGMTK